MAERTCETCGAKNDAERPVLLELRLLPRLGHRRLDARRRRADGYGPARRRFRSDGARTAADRTCTAAARTRVGCLDRRCFGDVAQPPITIPDGPPPPQPAAGPPPPVQQPPRPDAPVVTVATPEVTITSDAPGQVEFTIENASSIVDGYDVEAVDPPLWLALEHPDIHLMPGEGRSFAMSLGMRPGTLVVAQRVMLTFLVVSQDDRERRTEARVLATVPPQGPRPALEARPTLIRLEDSGEGSFSLRLDNRAANYPQTVELSGSDSESVVTLRLRAEGGRGVRRARWSRPP